MTVLQNRFWSILISFLHFIISPVSIISIRQYLTNFFHSILPKTVSLISESLIYWIVASFETIKILFTHRLCYGCMISSHSCCLKSNYAFPYATRINSSFSQVFITSSKRIGHSYTNNLIKRKAFLSQVNYASTLSSITEKSGFITCLNL